MKHTQMRRRARRTLSLLFALILLWEGGALTPKARAADVVAADGTVTFVAWEKATASDEFFSSRCSDGPHPILMSYKSNKTQYFMCATKDNWRWEKNDYNLVGMPSVYDRQFDDFRDLWSSTTPWFATIGTYNTPWVQYKGKDSDNHPKVVLNVSNGADGPGEYLGPGKSYGGQTYGGNKVRDTSFVVRPEETKPFRVTYDDLKFRMWNYDKDGDNEDVVFDGGTIKLSDSSREHIQAIMAGTVINASALTHDFTVLNDQATTMGRPISYIPEGVTLRVANGGVLTVAGLLLNDGKIVVEQGGLLVVRNKGVIVPFYTKKMNCGGISSAGTVVVERGGIAYGGGLNGIYLTGGVVYNYGTIASENFTATKKNLINNQSGAYVVAGTTVRSVLQSQRIYDYLYNGLKAWMYSPGSSTDRNLPYGRVSIADGAVCGDTSRFRNYGSFGDAAAGPESRLAKVFYHDESSSREVLRAPRSELGYHLSGTGKTVTRREVLFSDPKTQTLRDEYLVKYLREHPDVKRLSDAEFQPIFDAYLESYFSSQGIDLDGKVTVRDGVITLNGLPALTVPWNQTFSIVAEPSAAEPNAAEPNVAAVRVTMYFVKRQRPVDLGETVPIF